MSRRISFERYPLDRIVGIKEKQGFVKYACKVVGIRGEVHMRESDFKTAADIEELAQFKYRQTGQRHDPRDDTNFLVEKIRGHRLLDNGKRVYSVQFEGWSHPVWWWELKAPELKRSQNILNAYRKQHKLRQYTDFSDDEESDEEEEEESEEEDEEDEEDEENDAEQEELIVGENAENEDAVPKENVGEVDEVILD